MFAFVALASARILNWKKERLILKTDVLRNLYLVIAFFAVLYGLYHAVPGQYISLSWTMAAVAYFLMSILIHNVKYRWMAILTIIASVIYLFLVDLASLDIRYRVAALLFLAIISLGVSIFYTKRIKMRSRTDSQ